ncbi:MAG: ABC transporter permease [Rhodospirillaceae bacterium]|nr:ABC transporter permease [Rhodospirillaceae bacterium]MBL6930327.1 ABC transporter permease [Rhodospirillales bacterium]
MIRHRPAVQGLSVLGLLVCWYVAATLVGSRLLPGPVAVFQTIFSELGNGEMLPHIGATLSRVVVSFFIAMIIGAAIGISMGSKKHLDDFFDSWLILFLNIPALVTIILCYVWFGLSEAAAVLAVSINKIPNVAVTLREGARAIDRDLLDMANCFKIGRGRTLRHIVLPQLYPFLAVSARSGLALIWKIVLVVELLGRGNGVGFQLGIYFQLFDVTGILAYSLAFIIVIQGIEHGLLQPIERRVTAWQR